MANFPTSDPAVPQSGVGATAATAGGGINLRLLLNKIADELTPMAVKLGYSAASPADTPVADRLLGSDASGKSKWMQAVTAQLAANAVTQAGLAVGSTSDPTTTSSSYADMTDMSVTLTTVGGPLIALFASTIYVSAVPLNLDFAVRLDSGSDLPVASSSGSNALYKHVVSGMNLFTGVSAGSHTVKARWKTSGGTLTAHGLLRQLLVVELKR